MTGRSKRTLAAAGVLVAAVLIVISMFFGEETPSAAAPSALLHFYAPPAARLISNEPSFSIIAERPLFTPLRVPTPLKQNKPKEQVSLAPAAPPVPAARSVVAIAIGPDQCGSG